MHSLDMLHDFPTTSVTSTSTPFTQPSLSLSSYHCASSVDSEKCKSRLFHRHRHSVAIHALPFSADEQCGRAKKPLLRQKRPYSQRPYLCFLRSTHSSSQIAEDEAVFEHSAAASTRMGYLYACDQCEHFRYDDQDDTVRRFISNSNFKAQYGLMIRMII